MYPKKSLNSWEVGNPTSSLSSCASKAILDSTRVGDCSLMLCEGNFPHPVVVVESWLKRHAPKHDGTFAIEVRSEQNRKGNWHIREFLRAENPEVEQERRHNELLRTVIRANPRAGQEQIAKLAAEQGLARDAAIKLLKAGRGRYWKLEKVGHTSLSSDL